MTDDAPPREAAPSEPLVITSAADGGSLALVGELDRHTVPAAHARLMEAVVARTGQRLGLDLGGLEKIDSAGVALVRTLTRKAEETRTELGLLAVSPTAKEALELFRFDLAPERRRRIPGALEALGQLAVERGRGMVDLAVLAGDTIFYAVGSARRTARVRRGATWSEAVKVGADALPIVGLIAFLVGVVVGLQSAAQLRQFGASIYVADLIAISMTREMGPLMTAIIVAGRSGAAIAAEVATMQVSQEIDALSTMGLSPVRYIVVPKFLALTLTLPCLTVFASTLGIIGGFVVALLYLDLGGTTYLTEVGHALKLDDFLLGFLKSVSFAWIIVLLAAHRGFQARGGAESVGRVTTTSVVSAIFWVIVADAMFSLVFYFEG